MLEGADDGTSVKKMIGMNVFYVVVGLMAAAIVGNSLSLCFCCCDKKEEEEGGEFDDIEGEKVDVFK